MLNTLLPFLLAVPITVTPYRSPEAITVKELCSDLAVSLSEAVDHKVIKPEEALAIYLRCLLLE